MMNLQDISTWSVSKGIAKPHNIYTNFHPVQHPWFPFDRSRQQWSDFEKEAQQHTYATNAPDGSYSADRFGEITEQGFSPAVGWVNKQNVDWASWYLMEKRKFLPFIDQVKAKSPKFVEAEIQCQNKQQDIEIGFVRAEALKEVCKVYGDDFINENIQAASALIEMYIKGYVLSKIGLPSPPKTL